MEQLNFTSCLSLTYTLESYPYVSTDSLGRGNASVKGESERKTFIRKIKSMRWLVRALWLKGVKKTLLKYFLVKCHCNTFVQLISNCLTWANNIEHASLFAIFNFLHWTIFDFFFFPTASDAPNCLCEIPFVIQNSLPLQHLPTSQFPAHHFSCGSSGRWIGFSIDFLLTNRFPLAFKRGIQISQTALSTWLLPEPGLNRMLF